MNFKEAIERLCHLQEKVSTEVFAFKYPADCFCGEGGFWDNERFDGTEENGYRNDGKSIEFIEQAVEEKIKNKWQHCSTKIPPYNIMVLVAYPSVATGKLIRTLGWLESTGFWELQTGQTADVLFWKHIEDVPEEE